MSERSLRRAAQARGLVIAKSQRRDPAAPGFRRWAIRDRRTGAWVAGVDAEGHETFSYAQVQAYVLTPGRRRRNGRGR